MLNAIIWTPIFGLPGILISFFESNKGMALGIARDIGGGLFYFFAGKI